MLDVQASIKVPALHSRKQRQQHQLFVKVEQRSPMERRSFLKATKATDHASTRHFFHGVDLSAQPFLTKRGRKTQRVVKRVFVILDGYLFYFQSALSSEPCGVIPLEHAEYFTHSYASSERLSNFCFELRSPARDWGSIILHFHNFEPSKVHDVERILEAAGATCRRTRQPEAEAPATQAAAANGSGIRRKSARQAFSRLFTLSRRLLAPRAYEAAADADDESHHIADSVPRITEITPDDPDSQPQGTNDQEAAAMPTNDQETVNVVCRSTKGPRNSLVKLQVRRPLIEGISKEGGSPGKSPSKRSARNTIAFSGRDKFSIALDQGDFVAEQSIAVELCHDLCTTGYAENSGRKLLHFMAPFWPWEKQRNHADGMLLAMDGDSMPRIRFATTLEAQRTDRAHPTATECRGVIEISAVEGKMFASIQMGKERALSFPIMLTGANTGSGESSPRMNSPRKLERLTLAGETASASATLFEQHTVALRPPSPQKVSHGSVFLSTGTDQSHLTTALSLPAKTLSSSSVAIDLSRSDSTLSFALPAASLSPSKRLSLASPPRLAPRQQFGPPVQPMLLPLSSTSDVCLSLDQISRAPPSAMALPSPKKLLQGRSSFAPSLQMGAALPPAITSRTVMPPTPTTAASYAPPTVLTAAKSPPSPSPSRSQQSPPPPPPPSGPTGTTKSTDVRLIQAVSVAESYSGSCHLKKYEPIKMIGCGGFGHVMVARHKSTGQLVAIKSLSKKAVATQNQIQHSLSEKAVLTMCRNHPFIIQLHAAFQTIDHLHMVLDYCSGGELFFHLSQAGRFREHQAAFYTAEVFLALEHLHLNNIIYRDLKPENILLDKHGHVRLADFGLSKCGVDDWAVAMTFCGSIEYLAPEVLALGEPSLANSLPAATQNRKGYGKAADFWALGCLLFELLTGEPPFYSGNNRPQLYSRIMKGVINFPSYVSADAKHLIQGLLTLDPAERLGAKKRSHAAIREHAFFSKYVDWDRLLHRNVRPPFQPRQEEFANFDKQFTSMPVGAVDKMTQFPRNIPMDYQLFENYNWEPTVPK